MSEELSTVDAPKALGPYSQGVRSAQTVYCSGQIGLNPQTGQLAEGTVAQATQALHNLRAVLKAAGLTPRDVVKGTVLLADINDFQAVNQVYGEFFAANEVLPARSAIGVAVLPAGALVEIEAIAQR